MEPTGGFQEFREGVPISYAEMERLATLTRQAAFPDLTGPTGDTGPANSYADPLTNGPVDCEAIILSNGPTAGTYAWAEVVSTGPTTQSFARPADAGLSSANGAGPLIEDNGNQNIAPGTVVRARLREDGQSWGFSYPAALTTRTFGVGLGSGSGGPPGPPGPGESLLVIDPTTYILYAWTGSAWVGYCPCVLPSPSGSGSGLLFGSGAGQGVYVPCCPVLVPVQLCVVVTAENGAPSCLAGNWTLTYSSTYGCWYVTIPAAANCCPNNDIRYVLCCDVQTNQWVFCVQCAAPGQLPVPSCSGGSGMCGNSVMTSCDPLYLDFNVTMTGGGTGGTVSPTTLCGSMPAPAVAVLSFSGGTGDCSAFNGEQVTLTEGNGYWTGEGTVGGVLCAVTFGFTGGAQLAFQAVGDGQLPPCMTGNPYTLTGNCSPFKWTGQMSGGAACCSSVTMTVAPLGGSSCSCLPQGGVLNATAMQCLNSGGGGGGSGGGGSISTPCCPSNGLPATLYLHLNGGGGACSCVTNVYPLTWTGGYIWSGVATACGHTMPYSFMCQGPSGFQLTIGSNTSPVVVASSCNPLTWSSPMTLTGTPCVGTITASVLTS